MKISSLIYMLPVPFRLLPVIFGWYIIPIAAQQSDYLIKTFSVEQGLAHPNVRCMVKDSTGFLWIGTFDGLSRFDGNEFVTYRHSPDDSTSLPANETRELCVDRDNTLWILASHLVRFDRASEKFVAYFTSENISSTNNTSLCLRPDKQGYLWVCRTNEILRYNKKNDAFDQVTVKDRNKQIIKLSYPAYMNFDENGICWFVNSDGIESYKIVSLENSDQVELMQIARYALSKEAFHSVFPVPFEIKIAHSQTDIFLASNFGLFRLDIKTQTFLPVSTIPEKSSFIGCNSFTWSDMKSDIHAFVASKKVMLNIVQADFLQMESSFIDPDGSFWFSGLDKGRNWIGLRHAIPLTKAFRHYFESYKGKKTGIYSIFRDYDKSFWVGVRSKEYIVHLDSNGKPGQVFPYSNLIMAEQTRQNIDANYVRAINKDQYGNLWFGFLHTFLYSMDGYGFTQFLPGILGNPFVGAYISNRQILPLKNGKILIGGGTGMYLIDPVDRKIKKTLLFSKGIWGLYDIFQDNQGSIWTGNGSSTLSKFDQELNPIDSVRLSNDYYNLEGITGNADTLWISSMGGGLIRYITKTRSVKSYTTRDGLPHNYTYHLFTDSQKNIWISTNNGLSEFNPRTEIFTNFSETDGLRINEFNADAGFKAEDGELFFGGIGGFVGFYPDSVYKVKQEGTGRLLITNVSVSGIKQRFLEPVYILDTIFLGQGDDNLQLTFACLDFDFPERINYRYRLEEVDNSWCLAMPNNRNANYASLSPGWYRFVVEVADKKGNWSLQKAVTIHIPAFYYQTIWFKLSIGILAFSLIALFLWMKYNQVRLLNLKRQETLRMQSLQAQLNPHFIFNSLNSISYLMSNKPQEMADQYVADFASLMRSFLDNSSRDFILLSEEIESIEHYLALEHLRLNEKFDYRIECSPTLETDAIEVIPSLIQPFIENAIWHGIGMLKGRKGTIVVKFTQNFKNLIICTVEDDGIGRVKAGLLKSTDYRKRQSKGVNLILDRLKIINSLYKTDYQVLIEDLTPSAEETGTKVTIPLPVKLN